ncbi:MAG TPA: hypothetical protein VJK04_02835 [Candidatus Paceibacterota bacterium]
MNHQEWVLAHVIRLPQGEAPEGIRQQWIGSALSGRLVGTFIATGLLTDIKMPPRETFLVPWGIAIQTLEKNGHTEAALYFIDLMRKRGRDALEDNLCFEADEVEIISRNKEE